MFIIDIIVVFYKLLYNKYLFLINSSLMTKAEENVVPQSFFQCGQLGILFKHSYVKAFVHQTLNYTIKNN